jgi:hypothetical protein
VLKTVLKFIAFLLICYVMVEVTYRFYAAGTNVFHPAKFNSMNMMLLSGLIKESDDPEIYFELKPNLDTWFQAVKFKTNSVGLADDEYQQEKPADTFRVAVIGSSWTMATGVVSADTYHSALEQDLAELDNGTAYEFINFAVEYYGLREQVATVRSRAMDWDPDLIIFGITSFTANIRWTDATQNEPLPERTYPFFSSYSLRELDRILKTRYIRRGLTSRSLVDYETEDEMHGQLKRAVNELAGITAEKDIPVVIVWLSYNMPSFGTIDVLRQAIEKDGMFFVDAYEVLSSGNDDKERKFQASRFDKHPNREGHRMIADYLKQALQENNLLPGV